MSLIPLRSYSINFAESWKSDNKRNEEEGNDRRATKENYVGQSLNLHAHQNSKRASFMKKDFFLQISINFNK